MFFRNITFLKMRFDCMDRIMPEIVNAGIYDASLIHKNTVTKNRRVHIYEIEYILSDGGTSYINNKSYPIKKGGIICSKPGHIRHTALPFKCLYVHFVVKDEDLKDLLNLISDYYTPLKPDVYEELFRNLISSYTFSVLDSSTSSMAALFKLISMLNGRTSSEIDKNSLKSNNSETINRALEYIDENYCRQITLEDIAKHVHLSKIYFHNLFIAAVGQTTRDYILAKRFSKAKKMLITTDKNFLEIALECGFSSQAYFNYAFKKELNCTPKEYKRESSMKYLNNIKKL